MRSRILPLAAILGVLSCPWALAQEAAAAPESALSDWLWPDLLPAPWNSWLRLLAAAAVVIVAGSRLSRYGGMISDRLRLGQAVVGMIFVAFATTLPEIVTCIGAVAVQKKPELAVGNGFGSIAFNLTILVLVDAMSRGESVFRRIPSRLARPGLLSLGLIAIFGASMALEAVSPWPVGVLGLGAGSAAVLAAYVLGVWWSGRRGGGEAEAAATAEPPDAPDGGATISTAGIFARYGLVALAILWAGLNLSAAGDALATQHGMSRTFVGVMFLAISTSLPEVTVAIVSARAGMHEMILGNIFGANMFNVVVIAFSDLFYRQGTIARATVRGTEALPGVISVSFAAAISCVAIFGVLRRPRARLLRLSVPSLVIGVLYLTMSFWLYRLQAG